MAFLIAVQKEGLVETMNYFISVSTYSYKSGIRRREVNRPGLPAERLLWEVVAGQVCDLFSMSVMGCEISGDYYHRARHP